MFMPVLWHDITFSDTTLASFLLFKKKKNSHKILSCTEMIWIVVLTKTEKNIVTLDRLLREQKMKRKTKSRNFMAHQYKYTRCH